MAQQDGTNVGNLSDIEIKAIREEALALQNDLASIGSSLNST